MRLLRLLPALATILLPAFAAAQGVPVADTAEAGVTLFYPRTVARAEERSYEGTATWRMVDLGPTRGLEAVLSFPGIAADMIVLIEENPYSALPDDILIHAWPEWAATPEGPAVASAYVVGVETGDEAQIGLIGTARGDWTIGLMAAASERNHARLAAADVLIIELGLPDGKAYVGLRLGPEQHLLLAGVVPVAEAAFPLPGPAEQRILGANAPDGTGAVLWDTPRDSDGGTVRARIYLYDRAARFDITFAITPAGLVATVAPQNDAAAAFGHLAGLSIRTPDGDVALPPAAASAVGDDGTTRLTFAPAATQAAIDALVAGSAVGLVFADAAGAETPVLVALPQSWEPFTFLAPAP